MVKVYFCEAIVPQCTARFEAENEAAILAQVVRHAHEDHGMEHVPDAVLDAVRTHIRDAE